MKLAGGQSLYHKGQPLCDLSDESTGNGPSVNRPFSLSISVAFDSRHLLPLAVGSSGFKRIDFPVIDLTVEITTLHGLYGAGLVY